MRLPVLPFIHSHRSFRFSHTSRLMVSRIVRAISRAQKSELWIEAGFSRSHVRWFCTSSPSRVAASPWSSTKRGASPETTRSGLQMPASTTSVSSS